MKKIVIAVACIASLMLAKECKTMADLINGCVKTEYNYYKKPIKQSEWKNKKEVRVIYTKEYYNYGKGNLKSDYRGNVRKEYYENGNLKSDCSGEKGQNEVCKYYRDNGEFRLEERNGEPYNGIYEYKCSNWLRDNECGGELKEGVKVGIWKTRINPSDYNSTYKAKYPINRFTTIIVAMYVNGVKNGIGKIYKPELEGDYTLNGVKNDKGGYALIEEGQYLNDKKNGIWKGYYYDGGGLYKDYYTKKGEFLFEGEFKDGKLLKFTHYHRKSCMEYEYLGDEQDINFVDMSKDIEYLRIQQENKSPKDIEEFLARMPIPNIKFISKCSKSKIERTKQ